MLSVPDGPGELIPGLRKLFLERAGRLISDVVSHAPIIPEFKPAGGPSTFHRPRSPASPRLTPPHPAPSIVSSSESTMSTIPNHLPGARTPEV